MARFDDKKLQTDNLVDKLVSINRVSKTVKGGRNMSFSALVVVGDNINNFHTPEMMNSVAAKYLQPGDSDLLRQALEIIICEQKVSTSYLQRRLGIGYNRSAELMDELEDRGIISAPLPGGQKREILITDGLDEE